MSEDLKPRVEPIKKVGAIGAAIVLAGAATVGLAAEASSSSFEQNGNVMQTTSVAVELTAGVPAAIISAPDALAIPKRAYNPKDGLSRLQLKPQTRGNLPNSTFSSKGIVFRKG